MAGGLLFDGQTRLLQQTLGGLARRQELIANNVSNVDTPGYRSMDIRFEQVLDKQLRREGQLAMARTSDSHMSGPDVVDQAMSSQDNLIFRTDGNGVDVDAEMAKLSETGISFNVVTQLLNARLGLMRLAVKDGRG
ncbi:MAG TPA: flagellar basal body rod protein FlgB [Chloroflexota bacterium]|nr:flagellar basal body rod protein FlgB [Chloroflexota bacterium]